MSKLRAALVAAGTLAVVGAAGAETVTYKGTGTFVATRTVLPLANGAAAMHVSNDVVATIEPSESGFMFGDCAGLGYSDADGATKVRAYCTFNENDDDGFAIEVAVEPEVGGTVEVLGGSGRFAGATGTGTLEPRYSEGYRGSYTYEFQITTP